MNARKQAFQRLLRRLRLLGAADQFRFALQLLRVFRRNRRIQANNPGFAFPPPHLLYEIGGNLDFAYHLRGEESARFLERTLSIHHPDPRVVLDWGCGVSCVCRHLKAMLPVGSRLIGCDINREMIEWAKRHLGGIEYHVSDLRPPLPCEKSSIDWVYGLSVFTHLDQPTIALWLEEMARILSDDGILLLTTNGTNVESVLLPGERELYESHGYAIRAGLTEGSKMYLSFHQPEKFRKLLEVQWTVLEFKPQGMPLSGQDVWVLRKRK